MKNSHPNPIFPGVFSVIIVLVAISAYNHMEVRDISERLHKIVSKHNVLIQLFSQAKQLHRERTFLLQSLYITGDPFEQDELLIEMNSLFGKIQSIREQVLELELAPDESKLVSQHYLVASRVMDSQRQAAQQIIGDNNSEASITIKEKVIPSQDEAFVLIDQIIALQNQHNTQDLSDTNQQIRTINTVTALLLLFGILFIIVTAFFVNRRIRHEIAHRYESEKQLRNSELRERLIRENIIDSVITINHNGIIQSCNKATTAIFGYAVNELVGQNINILMPEPERSRHDTYLTDYLDSGKGRVIGVGQEFTARRKDGTTIPIDLEVTEASFDSQRMFIGVIRDITEKKDAERKIQEAYKDLEHRVKERTMSLEQTNRSLSREIREREKAQQQLTYLATHDPLTSLPNRTVFTEHIEKAIKLAKRNHFYAALLFMDLDGFKTVNDTFGHEVGDKLLKAVCQRFKSLIRDVDTVARLGGDEFGVILCDLVEISGAEIVAGKLVQALQEPFLIDGKTCEVGISIGISYYPADGEETDTLLSKADDAMYEAKRGGKNTYRVYRAYSAAL